MNIYHSTSSKIVSFAEDSSNDAASVVCSWPLSGQYGPGARLLYYVLVVVCIFVPHVEWLRSACLAAALLFPSIAAIHALIMTPIQQTKGPVDMDIFGCFQLCAVGVLAVPITVRYSKTYFETKGRNLVFMWTALNLAGLVSLIVAFYRASPQPCLDSQGNNVTVPAFLANSTGNQSQTVCSPQCSYWTLIRKDTTNASQWVLAPSGMTFNTATLLCAACCIPAILSLVSVWEKVMHITWIRRWSQRHDTAGNDGENRGREGLTEEEQRDQEVRADERWMDKKIRLVLGLVERIVFMACIMAIVVLGERNFWSQQMRSGVEPITAIGQWGPIVGAVLAVVGPLSVIMSSSVDDADSLFEGEGAADTDGQNGSAVTSGPTDAGHRAKVNKSLFKVLKVLGTPGADRFAEEVPPRKFYDFPEIPGEKERNPELSNHKSAFRKRQQSISRTPSRASLRAPSGSNTLQHPQASSSPSSRLGSSADLPGQQSRFLRVPYLTREMPVRADTTDNGYHSRPSMSGIGADSDPGRSSNMSLP